MSEFRISKASDGKFYWEFIADNHETVCVTETYNSKQSAKHSIQVIKDEAAAAKINDTTD